MTKSSIVGSILCYMIHHVHRIQGEVCFGMSFTQSLEGKNPSPLLLIASVMLRS